MKTLNEAEVGDKVIIRNQHSERVDTITRVTKCYVEVGRTKYRKKNGRQAGGDTWSSAWIDLATEGGIAALQRRKAVRNARAYLNNLDFSKLADDAVLEVLQEVRKRLPEGK